MDIKGNRGYNQGYHYERRPDHLWLKNRRFARVPRNFNIAVLAGPRKKEPANIQIAWDLSRAKYAAYLDCIPDAVGRFEELVKTLPGFERKETSTHLWMNEKFEPDKTKLLLNAMIALKNTEQSAL